MTRRSLLSMLAVIPGLALLGPEPQLPRQVVGPMTIDRERRLASKGVKVTVFAGGVDVTRRCYFADDTPGHEAAYLFRHNAQGRPYFDPDVDDVARERLTADVRIVLERCQTTA